MVTFKRNDDGQQNVSYGMSGRPVRQDRPGAQPSPTRSIGLQTHAMNIEIPTASGKSSNFVNTFVTIVP